MSCSVIVAPEITLTLYDDLDATCLPDMQQAAALISREVGPSFLPTANGLMSKDHSKSIFGIAKIGDLTIGSIYGYLNPSEVAGDTSAEIQSIVVTQDYQRSSARVGSHLLQAFENLAVEKGATEANLYSLEDALGFWDKHNYICIDPEDDPCKMSKALS